MISRDEAIEGALHRAFDQAAITSGQVREVRESLARSGYAIVPVETLSAIGRALANNDIEDAAQIVRAAQEREGRS